MSRERDISKDYYYVESTTFPKTPGEKFTQVVKRTFRGELFVGLWIMLREMFKFHIHTTQYPSEKLPISPRYRALHEIKRLMGSGNQRCIACGLCEKICPSNCIRIEGKYNRVGRKIVKGYTINLGRCIYCGYCAEVCPELAITHTRDYENVSEQRAHFTDMSTLVTPMDIYKAGKQQEFAGYGSVSEDADEKIKKTPLAY